VDRKLLLTLFAFVSLAGSIYVLYRILAPFLPAMAWATVVAIVTFPLYGQLRTVVGGRDTLASSLMTVLVFLTIVVPTLALAGLLLQELVQAEQVLQTAASDGRLARLGDLLNHPTLHAWLDRIGAMATASGIDLKARAFAAAHDVVTFLLGALTAAVTNLLAFLFQLVLIILVLFFAYRDGLRVERAFWSGLRVHEPMQAMLRETIGGVVSSVVIGVVVTAAVQGLLGGIGFWFVGLPSPVLFGALMAVSAFIPIVGSALVWVPAAAYLALTGETVSAAGLATWGVLAIGGADNILRPILISGGTGLPLPLMMLGALGGLIAFGFLGLVLGPLAIALFLVLFERYRAWDRPAGAVQAQPAVGGAAPSNREVAP